MRIIEKYALICRAIEEEYSSEYESKHSTKACLLDILTLLDNMRDYNECLRILSNAQYGDIIINILQERRHYIEVDIQNCISNSLRYKALCKDCNLILEIIYKDFLGREVY